MDTYKIKWTRLQAQVFRLLCVRSGQTLNLREMAKLLKVSPTAVSQALKGLKKERLITVRKSETINLLFIGFNRENHKAIQQKRAENLRMLYETGLADFLYNEFPGCTIILFGSYSLGEDVWFGEKDERNSDFDIAIIGPNAKEINLSFYGKLLERTISLNFYKSWGSIHKHLKENILKGIILSGNVEL